MINKICALTTIIAYLMVDNTNAWTAIGNYHDDAHPGKCFISDEVILSPGEVVKSPFICAKITCNNENGDTSTYGCGSESYNNCKEGDPIDINADYPLCCANHIICPEEDELGKQYETSRYESYKRRTNENGVGSIPKPMQSTF